jgi:hypothetical protein
VIFVKKIIKTFFIFPMAFIMATYLFLFWILFMSKRKFVKKGYLYLLYWFGFFKNKSYGYLEKYGIDDIINNKIIFSKNFHGFK